MNSGNRENGGRPRGVMRIVGTKGAILIALLIAVFIAVSSMASAMAATAILVGGLGASTLSDLSMRLALGGKFTGIDPVSGTPWQRVSVTWPAQAAPLLGTVSMGESVAEGTANLLAAIQTAYSTTGGPITVFGMSEGSAVVDEAMRALLTDPTAPPRTAINFIVAGDSTQRQAGFQTHTYGGYTFQPPPVTPYDLTVVTYEYDGWSDWPDRPWNLLADANAMAGAAVVHRLTYFVDLSTVPASEITVTTNASGGVTTRYLIPPATLPLVTLHPELAPQEAQLKQRIDAGYSRNDPTTASSSPSAAVTASPITAAAAIAPNPQSLASTIGPPVGQATNSGQKPTHARQAPANPAPLSSTPATFVDTQATTSTTVEGAKATRPTGEHSPANGQGSHRPHRQ